MCLESFKTDELQQISDISGRKPVLLGARHLHPDPFGKGNERLPKMVVSCNQHTSMSLAKRRQIAQRLKHIHRIADVVKEDVIEFFVWLESALELVLVRESHGKFERWTSLLCDFYNLRADVNGFALTGLENSQKIAGAATHRENFFLWLHQKTKEPVKQFVIVSVAVDPALAPSSNLGQMISRALASLLKGGWSPRRCVRLALARKSGHAAATV